MKRFLVLIVISLTFAGCYTRVAVKEDLPEYTYYDDSEQYGNYSQQYDSDSAAYDTVYYDDSSSEEYRGLEDRVVNNYYYDTPVYDFSPWYRVSVLSPYYDPYYSWDYFWYTHSWCSPRVYFDGFYFGYYWRPYYNDYWYTWDNYYNYGYYGYAYNYNGGYSNYGTHPGHTRNNDGGRRTRDNGRTVTNSFGNTTRENTFTGREILKDREKVTRTEEQIRRLNDDKGIPTDRLKNSKREIKIDNETNTRKIFVKDNNNTRIIRDNEPKIQTNREFRGSNDKIDNPVNRDSGVRKKIYIKRENEDRRTVERKTDRNDYNREYQPPVNQNRNNDNRNTNRNYEPPVKQNRENPPTREYRNQEPPRNYTPPVNNNNGNNSRGNNESSRNSGTRERR